MSGLSGSTEALTHFFSLSIKDECHEAEGFCNNLPLVYLRPWTAIPLSMIFLLFVSLIPCLLREVGLNCHNQKTLFVCALLLLYVTIHYQL